ncbi:MAG TPA: serine/threonine-protein kinase [Kiritimatiellia bacterium]|nr:serine/threonine-protein kinase [Kiritimatiellia bacterium]HMO98981.1 serine/threonine-protein kinase [Kiritimatiellia bacterium]HMP96692.1 serine/threonine-protein kinase [Kiritimatiellia bacterium]
MIGQEFAGYTLTRRLANGGMTHLYVAVDREQHRVVLRRLKPDFLKDRRIRNSFLHGAEILSRLHHPNIVRLIKAGLFHDEPFMALEFVEAKNMKDLIQTKSPLLYLNVLTMFRQMAAAINHVHLMGYWHLDFKPENLIVREDGLVVLVDFDLALERSSKPVKLSPLPGTPAYLPPESLTRNIVDDQTDIFSFGVTCYEILTGRKPFEGVTPEDVKRNQIDPNVRPMRLSLHNIKIPLPLETLLFKCLAKRPEERYPSISLVTRDLETMV